MKLSCKIEEEIKVIIKVNTKFKFQKEKIYILSCEELFVFEVFSVF